MKEILVSVDTTTASQQRIELAINYFRFSGAHITGLLIKPEVQVLQYMQEEAFLDLGQQYDNELNVRIANAEQRFQKSVVGIEEYTNCIIEQGDINDVFIGHAHQADFIILGQHNPVHADDPMLSKPDDVILHSGRPVIVVPYVRCSTAFPKHIMVAWNGSREASRALYDAMPLLQIAHTVELCVVEENNHTSSKHTKINEMLTQLKRHGVNATARCLSLGSLSIGNVLLNHIANSGADMLVAGAYGHSRIREAVLGGVTRDLLAHCSIPLLMSN